MSPGLLEPLLPSKPAERKILKPSSTTMVSVLSMASGQGIFLPPEHSNMSVDLLAIILLLRISHGSVLFPNGAKRNFLGTDVPQTSSLENLEKQASGRGRP